MRGVRVGQYCGEHAMLERDGHEVFEKRAEEREGSRGKGSGSGRRRHRDDTEKRNLRMFSTPDTFRLVQHTFQPIVQASDAPM